MIRLPNKVSLTSPAERVARLSFFLYVIFMVVGTMPLRDGAEDVRDFQVPADRVSRAVFAQRLNRGAAGDLGQVGAGFIVIPKVRPIWLIFVPFLIDPPRFGNHPLAIISEGLTVRQNIVPDETRRSPGQGIHPLLDLASGARYRATGKRKTAIARVTLRPGDGNYLINGRPLELHFPRVTLQRNIRQPLETVGYHERMDVVARLHGGGISAQADALRHGVSRALLEADPNLRGELKRRGFLTRDSRAKERKKAGLKKARKRPQFSKR